MARKYSVPFSGTFTNAGGNADLVSIQPADDKPVKLVAFKIGQISEVGDTAEEGLELVVIRLVATVTIGSGGGTVITPPMDSADPLAGFVARANDTTIGTSSGGTTILEYLQWNIRASPIEFRWPEDDEQYKVKQGEALIIRCNTTAADDITAAWTAIVKEE